MTPVDGVPGRYQLLLVGQDSDHRLTEYATKLKAAVSAAFEHVGVNAKKFLHVIMPGQSVANVNPKMPVVGVLFASGKGSDLALEELGKLLVLVNTGNLIVPVVEDIANFGTSVPTEVGAVNGCAIADCGSEFERLAARVLEGFGLLRERRRLFISYRRTEASGVATQLYEALDMAGFDVFLDTHGTIRPGEPFQEILWHRLADTDVALLLDTPDFLSSRWTEEELARANTSTIQMLQLLWPGQGEVSVAAFSKFHPLYDTDFATDERLGPLAHLTAQSVAEIVDTVEALRARAIAARHAFLVREFVLEVRKEGLKVQQTLERNLVVSTPDGVRILVTPAIGVPDSERYQDADQLRKRDASMGVIYDAPPVLLYDQTGIRDRWLAHLAWLNNNVSSARSVSIADASAWLHDIRATVHEES